MYPSFLGTAPLCARIVESQAIVIVPIAAKVKSCLGERACRLLCKSLQREWLRGRYSFFAGAYESSEEKCVLSSRPQRI